MHAVGLYAVDPSRAELVQIDAEYVSEKGRPLPKARDSGSLGSSETLVGAPPSYPDGIAIAKPRLNANGLLVLDGSESINAYYYHWTVKDLSSAASFSREGVIVATEDIPAGFYKVTLNCTDRFGFFFGAGASDAVTSFYLVIPPRIALAARKVNGALHIRWTPGKVNGKWCFYVSGHVFDEIGATVFHQGASNLEVWVTVNGERLDLPLDDTGSFLARYVAGVKLADAYDLVLTAKTLDDGHEYEVDRLHETRLMVFPRLR